MKKFLGGMAVVALALTIGFNVNLNTTNEASSLLTMANVEALAGGDAPGSCGGPKVESGTKLYCKSENTVACSDLYGCD